MASFLPSEISRLVLGYLEEVNCMTAYDEFLKNCPDLQECRGRHFDTRVMGNTLINILRDYSKAEAEMYYNKNKELQRLLRQRWSLVQRMRFLVENVDMSKVRQYSSNNSPFPFSTPQRADNIRKPKLCPQCKTSDPCNCTRSGVVSPALSDLFTEPVNIYPVQKAPGSIPIQSLVEATPLSDLPGTSLRDKEELISLSKSKTCSKSKHQRAQLSHDSGVTNVSRKSLDMLGQNDNCPSTQDKEVIVIGNSEHNMSIDLSMKQNVLLECSEAAGHSEGQKGNCDENSSKDSASIVPDQIGAKENDSPFKEFLSGVAAQYDNETSEVIRESSTPDLILQRRLSSCATKMKPVNTTVTAAKVITPQITKEPALENKTIKTLLPRNALLPENCEENNYAEQMQAKPPDEKNTTKIYATKPNSMSSHDPDSNEIITLYGTDTKEYTSLQTIDISNFYHQTNNISDLKNTHEKQNFPPKPIHNEQKVIILSNEIVEPKTISCNKEPLNHIQETNYKTYNTMKTADKNPGLLYRSNLDSGYSNTAAVMHNNNRGIFNMKGNTDGFKKTPNETAKFLDPAVSKRLQAQICSTQSGEGGKATVLAGKLPELIISNGQVQLGQLQGKILDESKYYSEKEIMSMPTLIMLHSQTSGVDNKGHYNESSASSVSFLAQELPPLQTTHEGKPQSTVPSHIPTQPVQTKPNLSNHTKTTTVQNKTDTQTTIDSVEVHVDLTEAEVVTPHTNPEVKKSSSTPRRQNSHIRVLDFNTPSTEISSESKARTLPENVQDTPISASRTKPYAKSNLFDIKEFGDKDDKAGLAEVANTQKVKDNNFDAKSVTSQASEKSLVKTNVTCCERNVPAVKSKVEQIGVNEITDKVPGLKEWQAIRRREVGWDADLRALAAVDAAVAVTNPPKRPKSKPSRSKTKPKKNTNSKSLNTDGKELDISLENNVDILELAPSVDIKAKKKKKPPAPRKKNPPKKKKDQNAIENVSEHGNAICESKNPSPQSNIANQIVNPMRKPTEGSYKTNVQDNSVSKMYINDDAPTKLPPLQNHCIINDVSSITTVPGAKQALDKNIISINVGHYVNENVLQENSPNNTSTNNQRTKSENFLQRDNIEKLCNLSSDKDNTESPLLPYDIISPDVQFLLPSSAMRNLSSLLETPLKMSLDMPMMTPRFISPGSLIDPMSVLKHLEIPTPNFSNTPRTNLHGKSATPSSYVSRPTDYSSGSSYYKPDENEYRIDIAAGEDIQQNTNQEVFLVPNPEINDIIKQTNNSTCKGVSDTVKDKRSPKNQYIFKSLEISLEKKEAENNATPEQRSTRPRRTCTLKNLPRSKSPPVVIEKPSKKSMCKNMDNATSPESSHEDFSSSYSCSSSSSEQSSNSSSFSPARKIPQSSTPKELEIRKVDLLDKSQKSKDNHYTMTPQSKGKMSLQERIARSLEEKRKRIITKMSKSSKVSPKKPPARPRVRKQPPANKKKSVTKKTILNQSVNLCIRRDSTKPVSVTRTFCQGKKVTTNLPKESYQPTVSHKVPCLTKSRRKSSTPRKLQSSRLETESESHISLSAIKINASTLNNEKPNIAQKECTKTLSNSEQPTQKNRIVAQPLNNNKVLLLGQRPSEKIRSVVKRDESVDDIMQIKDYIAESANCDVLVSCSEVRQSNHYESAKRIESDLSDPTGETKGILSLNEGLSSVRKESKEINNMEENTIEHNNSKQETYEKQGFKEVEEQPDEELSDDEEVVEWTNSESGPGKSNYFCVSYSGIPPTNQFPRNIKFNPDTFCMSASIIVAETGAEDVRQMKVSPLVTIVNIAPSKIKSKSSKHSAMSKTKKTSQKSNRKEKLDENIKPIEKTVTASTPRTISPPIKNSECLAKFDQSNEVVSQMETLLAVQSIVQMDTLYTPEKSRMQLTDLGETAAKNKSSHSINHKQPSDDQMCESIQQELERIKQRQIMKDIGLTDSSDSDSSDSEESGKEVVESGSCRKRRCFSKTHHEEPPDKKCKPSGSKLDPQTFLKTMGIESVLSKIHGPSN